MRSLVLLGGVLATLASPAFGGAEPVSASWSYSTSVSTIRQPAVDLDSGGKIDTSVYHVRLAAVHALDASTSFRIGLKHGITDTDFKGSDGFAALAPWDHTGRTGINISLSHRSKRGWSYGLRPFVDWAYESGAVGADALKVGAAVAAVAGVSRHRHVGVGARLTRNIDGNISAVPLLVLDWRLNEQWALGNPRDTDFTEPVGLELRYRANEDWSAALTGIYRTEEFRLDGQGIAPRGTGKREGLVSVLRISQRWPAGLGTHAYLGAVFGGELEVEDAGGRVIAATGHEAAPFAGLAVEGSF